MKKRYPFLCQAEQVFLDALEEMNDHLLDLNMTLGEVVKRLPLAEEESDDERL